MSLRPATIDDARRPSTLWTLFAVVTAVGAVLAVLGALAMNRAAQRPIGEGELFREESRWAAESVAADGVSIDGLRHVRNHLAIEAVGLVVDGTVAASTSANLAATTLDSPLVAGFAEEGRFGAAAVTLGAPLEIDGVEEWAPGQVVYQVVQPLEGSRSLVLTYDISELLARRSAARATPATAIELLALGALLTVVAVGLLVARARALRTYREMRLEATFLKREAEALSAHNVELDEARRRAERAYELAEEKNRIRSEFVLMINHELRTPLTSVVTGAELLAGSDAIEDPAWKAVLEDMIRDGDRLREMIDQILAVARIENRALSFDLSEVSLAEVMGGIAGATDVSIAALADAGEDTAVRTDVTTLVNLIASLSANAITHGASSVEVSIARHRPFPPMLETAPPPDEAVYFVVEDDGPGIDPDFLPRVFEKFEKDSWSSGTGLGLYIARTIVEALEGSISVTTSSRGTAFAIALPAAGELVEVSS